MIKLLFCAALSLCCVVAEAASRESIHVVGSSTIFPIVKVVADRFAHTTRFRGPNIEATGTGGGFKIFCQGLGAKRPDIVNASRRIKRTEFDECVRNGVSEIIELQIGYDGIVIVNSAKAAQFELSLNDLYLALAKFVPDPKNNKAFVENPYRFWSDVNPNLPKAKIVVYGPPPSSGTRDSFVEMAMEHGCALAAGQGDAATKEASASVRSSSKRCRLFRGAPQYHEVGEQDNILIELVASSRSALGILGFNYLDRNLHRIKGAVVNGVAPSYENIHGRKYPISRPLYFYVKKAHIGRIPGIKEFLAEFTSEKAWGDDGYLTDKGLVPLEPERRQQVVEDLKALRVFDVKSIENTP